MNTELGRLRRSESFLGIHFDNHMQADYVNVGKSVTRKMIQDIIDKVRPDYIQVDCKGHFGISSYPTKIGYHVKSFAKDQLKLWREVTAANGVALYLHYSGVRDDMAMRKHPTWARVNEKGKRDKFSTSLFGPYVDKLMIPQIKELSDEYDIDGVWVDGECWGTHPDFAKKVMAEFTNQTGIKTIPRQPGQPNYYEYQEFCREAFRKYLRHYVDELHDYRGDFQICSNYAFTSFMPEKVSADVDFLSGDLTPKDGFNSARFESRVLSQQGKSWDLMSWSFSGQHNTVNTGQTIQKSAAQLKQEAASVIAIGGGYQVYFKQKDDGAIYPHQMEVMAEVADFCRERKTGCFETNPVPQVGLLYSGTDYYRKNLHLFHSGFGQTEHLKGTLNCLLDSQYSVDILMEHNLGDMLSEYPLLVMADCRFANRKSRNEIKQYVTSGGRLLAIGSDSVALCRSIFKCKTPKTADAAKFNVVKHCKGKIALLPESIGQSYLKQKTFQIRDMLSKAVEKLFPSPLVTVTGSHNVDVVLRRDKKGSLLVNLINNSGPHSDEKVGAFDEIPPINQLEVIVRTKKKPAKVMLLPSHKKLGYEYSNGKVYIKLNNFLIHWIIQIE